MIRYIRGLVSTIKEKIPNTEDIIAIYVKNVRTFIILFIFIISIASLLIYGEENGSEQIMMNGSEQIMMNGSEQIMMNGSEQIMMNGSEQIMMNGTKKEGKDIYEIYKLIWKDEFDDKELNATKWTAKNQNLSLDSGDLVLISEKKFYAGNEWKIDSGLIRSKDKFYFTYGYIEMRAKVVKGNGLLSALWLTGQNGWPPEIDIMEYLGIEPYSMYMTLHCNPNEDTTCKGVDKSSEDRQLGTKYTSRDWSLDYHIYSIEWTPDTVRWFVDDVEIYNVTTGVPKDPMYIVLSLCSHNCGDGWSERTDETTPNPAKFYIDYVKAYTKADMDKLNKDQINGEFLKIKRV